MIDDGLKIFLTFFLIFILFAHWVGWNETSRLDLTRSIVNQNSLNIDNYKDNTGDRSVYNNHYYSDKAPGSSILNTLFLWMTNKMYSEAHIDNQSYREQTKFKTTTYYLVETNFK
ncbi:MAG: hypothetical protein ABEK36_00285, partial [Candidatus Aenigmatarchaeota archaeon]